MIKFMRKFNSRIKFFEKRNNKKKAKQLKILQFIWI